MMGSLVDDIVALEKTADALIEKAHLEAKNVRLAAEAELIKFRAELTRDRNNRLVNLKTELNRKYQEAISTAESELAKTLNAIDQIPNNLIKQQVDRIVDRFREW